ncbi:MAG: hypothetical protein SW833_12985 [Cyanobacteriota bacterium]|nr:hypothetical protein [Cyanobacteriota bacterium]
MIHDNVLSLATGEGKTPASPAQPQTIPQIIQTPVPNPPQGKKPIRLLACGVPKGVNGIIHRLHVLGFAEVIAWTPPLPSPIEGEIIRVLTRHIKIES